MEKIKEKMGVVDQAKMKAQAMVALIFAVWFTSNLCINFYNKQAPPRPPQASPQWHHDRTLPSAGGCSA